MPVLNRFASSHIGVLLLLTVAAVLEAGGDLLIRTGLYSADQWRKPLLIAVGGATLVIYGVVVNIARWDFGSLLGVYVAIFFVVAQVLAWRIPELPVIAGGALILTGALLITFWRPR